MDKTAVVLPPSRPIKTDKKEHKNNKNSWANYTQLCGLLEMFSMLSMLRADSTLSNYVEQHGFLNMTLETFHR